MTKALAQRNAKRQYISSAARSGVDQRQEVYLSQHDGDGATGLTLAGFARFGEALLLPLASPPDLRFESIPADAEKTSAEVKTGEER